MPLTQIRQTVINEPYSGVIPIGGIVMFSGNIASLPSGWAFCDGTNGTPDLRDKFIIGAAADSSGQANTTVTGSTTKAGGSKDAVAVSHSHGVVDLGHSHTYTGSIGEDGTGTSGRAYPMFDSPAVATATFTFAQSNTTGISVNSAGESGTNKNLPPYYALAFIMRIS